MAVVHVRRRGADEEQRWSLESTVFFGCEAWERRERREIDHAPVRIIGRAVAFRALGRGALEDLLSALFFVAQRVRLPRRHNEPGSDERQEMSRDRRLVASVPRIAV